jgi:hypothetical protein
MVYYMKAMAAGLAKKAALPIAFAATAFVPALAGNTTVMIDQSFDRIAFDQTKTVEIKLTTPKADKVSFVEFDVILPEGLVYQEGTFKLADFLIDDEEKANNHTFKVEPIAGGFHATIFNDNLNTIAKETDLTEETIASFDITANTAFAGDQSMGLTIRDIVDQNADQLLYENLGAGGVEGAEGDNSIGSKKVQIDKTVLGGKWEISVASPNIDDEGVLVIDPAQSLFTPQAISVLLTNEPAANISALSFRLILPEGLTLDTKSLKLNTGRAVDKALSYNVIKEGGAETNDWVVEISGGVENAFKGTEGALVTFNVIADLSLCHAELDEQNPTFTDVITLRDIKVSNVHSTAAKQNDVELTVFNPNEKAYWELMNTADDQNTGTYTAVENQANIFPYDHVYDYKDVLDARNAAKKFIKETYEAGELGVNGNQDAANTLIGTYKTELEESAEANENLYEALKKEYQEDYPAQLAAVIPEGVTSFPAAPARMIEKPADELTVADFIDPTVAETYQAALDAIEAYGNTIEELYNQKSEVDPEKYDGALLADSQKPEAESKLAQKEKAVVDAINAFELKLTEVNEANKKEFDEILSGELTDKLNEAKKYVEELENAETGTLKGAYANAENFPEIKQAIDDAEQAIGMMTTEDGVLTEAFEAGTLPFEEGIKPVLDAIQGEGGILDLIAKIKPLADEAKKNNDDAFVAENNELLDKIYDPENFYGDFDGTEESLAEQPETYQAAYEAAQEAVNNYVDELGKSNQEGMVYKDLNNADSDLAKAKAAMDQALQELQTVVDNLTAVNQKVTEADQNLEDAENKLKEIREDEKYKYIDSSEKTAELMDAIDEKIKDLHERINDINEDANNGKDDWREALNKNGEVDKWLEDLQQIIDEIEGALDAEGNPVDGLDQDIEKAVETYDKFHKRGDANMDGRVSMIDYNTIMGYVREEASLEDIAEEAARNEQESQLNVVQEPEFGTDIEINITDAIGALWIYLNGGTDEGLGLGDRYYSARAAEAESLLASETMVNGVRRIALNLNNVNDYTAAQLDLVLPEGATLVAATLGERSNGHELFVGSVKDGRQRLVISNDRLNAFKGNEGAVLYIDVQGDGDVQFNNVIFATTHAQSTRFTVGAAAETTGIAGVKAAAEGEQVYSIGGRLMNAVKKGINIIRRADGTTQKVIKK